MRSATFLPTPGARASERLVLERDGGGELARLHDAEDGERHLAADALHGLQQAEPFALEVGGEAVEADHVLAHIGLDRQRHRLARRRQRLERAHRAIDLVADAADIDDRPILAVGVDDAPEFSDHGAGHRATAVSRTENSFEILRGRA